MGWVATLATNESGMWLGNCFKSKWGSGTLGDREPTLVLAVAYMVAAGWGPFPEETLRRSSSDRRSEDARSSV